MFNPLLKEFNYVWLNVKNNPVVLKMPPAQITYFPKFQADFMRKHLADEMYNSGQYSNTNTELAYKEIYKLINI
ncbi:MAG: hypothetical protein A2W11_00735 [Ignavibacteria bacterium RBG_16_35_7]|nr:MAG: hypothetical protein A2W11_00735 [Ignavibacteria bacterium RBG_16_35_7]